MLYKINNINNATNPFSVIPSISFWSVPAIVLRRLPRGFLERERRLTESVLLLSFASSIACKPFCTCSRDFLAADWRSKRFPLVSTLMTCAGYLKKKSLHCNLKLTQHVVNKLLLLSQYQTLFLGRWQSMVEWNVLIIFGSSAAVTYHNNIISCVIWRARANWNIALISYCCVMWYSWHAIGCNC